MEMKISQISKFLDFHSFRSVEGSYACLHVTCSKNCMLVNCCVSVSFDQVKAHIQTYLKNLEEYLLDTEDRTELYLLFVNCFQVEDTNFTSPLVFSASTL